MQPKILCSKVKRVHSYKSLNYSNVKKKKKEGFKNKEACMQEQHKTQEHLSIY